LKQGLANSDAMVQQIDDAEELLNAPITTRQSNGHHPARDRTDETSALIREGVVAARKRQPTRFAHKPKITGNARMGPKDRKEFCALDEGRRNCLRRQNFRIPFELRTSAATDPGVGEEY
jgi:predicted ATPase with chaperone activity